MEIANFSDRVRALLKLEKADIDDNTLESFDFKGIAVKSVKAAVPRWQEILDGGDEGKIETLKACVVIQTAIEAVPTVGRGDRKIEQTTNAKVEYFDNKYDSLLKRLYERLELLYAELNGVENMYYSSFPMVRVSNADKKYTGGGFV